MHQLSKFHCRSPFEAGFKSASDRDFRIRTHTGLDWPDNKLQTLTDIVHDPKCQIIIATNGLAQGNDIKVMKTVIQIGEPESAEIYVQKPGHARPCVQNPLAIFYISSNRMELAEKVVQQTDAENDADAKTAGSSVLRLNNGFTEDKQVVLQRVVILTEFYKMPTKVLNEGPRPHIQAHIF
jgi:superfamily II DNA/RNA helicase